MKSSILLHCGKEDMVKKWDKRELSVIPLRPCSLQEMAEKGKEKQEEGSFF